MVHRSPRDIRISPAAAFPALSAVRVERCLKDRYSGAARERPVSHCPQTALGSCIAA
jgi:hypothetical protein